MTYPSQLGQNFIGKASMRQAGAFNLAALTRVADRFQTVNRDR